MITPELSTVSNRRFRNADPMEGSNLGRPRGMIEEADPIARAQIS